MSPGPRKTEERQRMMLQRMPGSEEEQFITRKEWYNNTLYMNMIEFTYQLT